MKKLFVIFLFISVTSLCNAQAGWQQVTAFGTNPGALNMYSYAPSTLPANAPLVVVMHGCTQNAAQAAAQTGWNTMADRNGFYVVYPEQVPANNNSNCFNWFLSGDQSRNQGEALSIKQMVDHMIATYSIDASRIYVTGLSAGACMSNVMMGAYPEVFSKGAILAGVPYRAATNAASAFSVMSPGVTKTPTQWGDLVRNENPTYMGPFPRVAILHGTADGVVSINNAAEEVKQWTNVHGTDQTAEDTVASFANNSMVTKNSYYNSNGESVVETYIISGFGHAVPLDTGTCFRQCGAAATYAYEMNFSSTFWVAKFFGIIDMPFNVTGPSQASIAQFNIPYSSNLGSYTNIVWTVPPGAVITSGQGTSAITVTFGSRSGEVAVSATDGSGCVVGPASVWVSVAPEGVEQVSSDDVKVFYNSMQQTLSIITSQPGNISGVRIVNVSGQLVHEQKINSTSIPLVLHKGMYLVEVTIGEKVYWKKIMVM